MLQYNNTTISIYTSGALGSGLPWRMFSPSRWARWWPCAASPCPSASCSGSAAARARTRHSPPGCWICPHGKNIWRRIKNIFSPFPILHGRPAHAAVSGLPGGERLLLAAKEDSIHVQGRLGENICKTQKIFVIDCTPDFRWSCRPCCPPRRGRGDHWRPRDPGTGTPARWWCRRYRCHAAYKYFLMTKNDFDKRNHVSYFWLLLSLYLRLCFMLCN